MAELEEVALFTPAARDVIAFYRQLLGAGPDVAAEETATWRFGKAVLFVHPTHAEDEDPPPNWPPGADHFAFAVDDLEQECARLTTAGIAPEVGPRHFPWGKSAYFRDPDGRLVELHERRP